MSKVAQRYHHCFNRNPDENSAVFSSNVYVPFVPDEMIVKAVSYCGVNDGGEVVQNIFVWCNNLNQYIALIFDNAISNPNSVFTLGKSINGSWTFELRTIKGEPVEPDDVGKELSVMIEFVKYE